MRGRVMVDEDNDVVMTEQPRERGRERRKGRGLRLGGRGESRQQALLNDEEEEEEEEGGNDRNVLQLFTPLRCQYFLLSLSFDYTIYDYCCPSTILLYDIRF